MSLFRSFILIIFCLYSFNSTASDYYWFISTGYQGPSPSVVADNYVNNQFGPGTAYTWRYKNDTQWSFDVPGRAYDIRINRYGDSCTSPSTYNALTGECEAPKDDPCLVTVGSDFTHEYNAGSLAESVPPTLPPSTICNSSCQYSRTDTVLGCNRYLDTSTGKSLDTLYCKVNYKGTGQTCTADNPAPGSVFDQPPSKPPADAAATATEQNNCSPWVTGADGTLTRTCSSSKEYKDPGKVDCSVSGSSLSCSGGSTKYEKTQVDENTSKNTAPDGSTETTTEKTTDKTTCTGIKPCTSTTKQETIGSVTNPDGTEGDKEESCTGTGCTDSEGKDQQDREQEEAEDKESSVSGEACDVPVSCEGDAIQCAILRQQKADRCAFEEAMDYPNNKDQVDQLIQGEEFQVKEQTFQIPSFATQATRFLPSSGCPAPGRANLRGGLSLEMDYTPFCGFATGIAPVIVASALLFAALYVGRGLGGS